MYNTITDKWDSTAQLPRHNKILVHRKCRNLYTVSADTLLLFSASKGWQQILLKSDKLGAFYGVSEAERSKEFLLTYEKGLRVYSSHFTDYPFQSIPGSVQFSNYYPRIYPYVFVNGKKDETNLLVQLMDASGTDSTSSFFLQYKETGFT